MKKRTITKGIQVLLWVLLFQSFNLLAFTSNKETTVATPSSYETRTMDSLALVAFYEAFDGAIWLNNWNLNQPMTTWYGVELNTRGEVIAINLSNNQLLSEDVIDDLPLFRLPALEQLNLAGNALGGELPNWDLPSLINLDISNNGFYTISNLDKSPRLRALNVAGNIFSFSDLLTIQRENLSSFRYQNQSYKPVIYFNVGGICSNRVKAMTDQKIIVYLQSEDNHIDGIQHQWSYSTATVNGAATLELATAIAGSYSAILNHPDLPELTLNSTSKELIVEDEEIFTDFSPILVSNETAESCWDIKVRNFNNILTLQFGIDWDPDKFQYSVIKNINLAGFNTSNFSARDDGSLLLTWFPFDLTGKTYADDFSLFTICLNPTSVSDIENNTITIGGTADILSEVYNEEGECLDISFGLNSPEEEAVATANSKTLLASACTASSLATTGTSNIQFEGNSRQFGCFSQGDTSIQLSNGFILSTGQVADAMGPNVETNTSGRFGGGSDADLQMLPGTAVNLKDAAVVEFDLIASCDKIELEYVFASEEYCEYVGSQFTDVFGIFVSGPGINGRFSSGAENIATVPNSSTPVSINTINFDINGDYYVSNVPFFSALSGGCTFGELFQAADAVDLVEYDGFTTPLLASIATIPGQTYHIKIAIADAGDELFDSAVFFKLKEQAVADCTTTPPPTEENAPAIFTDYPWLSGLVNASNCSTEKITVYQSGAHQYLYVENEQGGKLYNQAGNLYCTGAANYDCIAAYSLTTIIAQWSCTGGGDTSGGNTDNGNGNTDNGGTDNSDDNNTDNGNTSSPVFSEYLWLTQHVRENDCTDESITVYSSGAHNFVFISNETGGDLYFQDGTFYCTTTPSYDCVQAYNLSTVIGTWSCGDAASNSDTSNGEGTSGDNGSSDNSGDETIFTEYPWLSDLINPTSCNGEKVAVYGNFVFVETATSADLYYQSGTFYCSSTPTYDCLALYNLSTQTNAWACGNTGNLQQAPTAKTKISAKSATSLNKQLAIFPNPTTGFLYVEGLPTTGVSKVQIFSATGQLLQQLELVNPQAVQALDLSNYSNGLYYVQVENEEGRVMKKIIVE